MFDESIDQYQLDRLLVPQLMGEEEVAKAEPLNQLEMRALKNMLWSRYRDPKDHVINDAYLQETFAASFYGCPDRLKQGLYGPVSSAGSNIDAPYGAKLHNMDGMVQKGMLVSNNGVPLGGGVTKDILTTTVTGDTGGGVLINQRIIPQLAIWFYTEFAALSRIARVPAQGLDFEWNNLIGLADDNDGFLDENGCPVAAASVYFRGRSNIALIGITRGTNLKLDLAIRAGGVLYNGGMGSYELEMMNAVTVRARLEEKCFFQGTTDSGHAADDEFGKTFANGFNGWRVLTSFNANTVHPNFYPTGYTPIIVEQDVANNGTISQAINQAATIIRNRGGRPSAVYCTFDVANRLAGEVLNQFRWTPGDNSGMTIGAQVANIQTAVGLLPIVAVPDNSIGSYPVASIGTPTINGVTAPGTGLTSTYCQDVYVASESDLALPYLGTPDPMPLEIPMGFSSDGSGTGCFNRRFIIYHFLGFAMTVPVHQAKIRVPASSQF